jgi:uncharacterized protein YjiS (DUF1127 family)
LDRRRHAGRSNAKGAAMTSFGLAISAPRRGRGLRRLARSLAARWRRVRALRQTRRYIMEMDERMLSDIGVSRAQALFEIDEALRRGG